MVSSKMDVKRSMPASYKVAMASDALPLPVSFTNRFFLALFFISTSFLVQRWGEKKKTSMPIYVLSLTDMLALLGFIASTVYLWGFFGIIYIQSSITKTDTACEDEDLVKKLPCPQLVMKPCPEKQIPSSCASKTLNVLNDKPLKDLKAFDNEDIAVAVNEGLVASHSLEKELEDCNRAINVRRRAAEIRTGRLINGLPVDGMDYSSVIGQCCEMIIGYVQVPVGVAGPLKLDGVECMVPMATTEGCLVASTNRGCKAIHMSGGASSVVLKDGITRAPVVRFGSAARAAVLKEFVEHEDNFEVISAVFNRTSRFAKLQSVQGSMAGRNLYMRFTCSTGDAMGMNMISKGVQTVLEYLQQAFPDMEIVSISGNYCADKKATAVNWIQGRGKSVVCEAVITEEVVAKVLKTSVSALIELNMLKNLTGSALAGAIGGFNAHAANIVSAVFIATGQDPAQNIESSQCITMMEYASNGIDLHISVTMPALEVGTVGGGTQLASQAACLNLLGVKGACMECPGNNAQNLARIIAGAVLAGELSLMSALAAGHLVNSHMKYNRSSKNIHGDVSIGNKKT